MNFDRDVVGSDQKDKIRSRNASVVWVPRVR